jgi:hypothetical protein
VASTQEANSRFPGLGPMRLGCWSRDAAPQPLFSPRYRYGDGVDGAHERHLRAKMNVKARTETKEREKQRFQ